MAEKRRSPCTLSVKAHAFSVEALIGAEKRRKIEEGTLKCFEDGADAPEDTGSAGTRPESTSLSDRGSEIECASDCSRKCPSSLNEAWIVFVLRRLVLLQGSEADYGYC